MKSINMVLKVQARSTGGADNETLFTSYNAIGTSVVNCVIWEYKCYAVAENLNGKEFGHPVAIPMAASGPSTWRGEGPSIRQHNHLLGCYHVLSSKPSYSGKTSPPRRVKKNIHNLERVVQMPSLKIQIWWLWGSLKIYSWKINFDEQCFVILRVLEKYSQKLMCGGFVLPKKPDKF